MATSKMVGTHVNALAPEVTPEQALELLELGFRRVDVSPQTLAQLPGLTAELPCDAPVVVVGETAELSRRATMILGRLGIDALDAGVLAIVPSLVA
jgi:hypothetical protein